MSSSHYAMGWLSIYGDRTEPACRFVEGFLQAAVEAAFGKSSGVSVEERRCFSCGHDDHRFRVEIRT